MTISWVDLYPWGRKPPEDRIRDLDQKALDLRRRREVFEGQVEDRRNRFLREEEILQAERTIAQKCLADNRIRLLRVQIYQLILGGVDVGDLLTAPLSEADRRARVEALIQRNPVSSPSGDFTRLIDALPENLVDPDQIRSLLGAHHG